MSTRYIPPKGINTVTSTDGTVVITDPTGPSTNLSVPNLLGEAATSALGSGSTTSSSFGNLSVTRANVTITTGTKALVIISGTIYNSVLGDYATLGVKVSGASTIAASGTFALIQESAAAGDQMAASVVIPFGTGGGGPGALTAGSNTFEAQLSIGGGGTATAVNVLLTVIPLD